MRLTPSATDSQPFPQRIDFFFFFFCFRSFLRLWKFENGLGTLLGTSRGLRKASCRGRASDRGPEAADRRRQASVIPPFIGTDQSISDCVILHSWDASFFILWDHHLGSQRTRRREQQLELSRVITKSSSWKDSRRSKPLHSRTSARSRL